MLNRIIPLLFLALTIPVAPVHADSVDYILDNVVLTNGDTLTGKFTWVYPAGDFSNGSGTFTELAVPGYGTDLSGLNTVIDLGSIEITLVANLDNKNLDITLRLLTPLSPDQPSIMDISQSPTGVYASKYDLTGYVSYTGAVGGFTSGRIAPLPSQKGDVDNNGIVDTADYLLARQIILDARPANAVEFYALDIAPLVNGVPAPDGQLNVGDLLLLSERLLGVVNF